MLVAFASLDNSHLSDQVKIRLISQIVGDISRVLQQLLKYFQKLLKYFNGTIISTSYVRPATVILPVIFCLNINEALLLSEDRKSVIAPLASKNGSSL